MMDTSRLPEEAGNAFVLQHLLRNGFNLSSVIQAKLASHYSHEFHVVGLDCSPFVRHY